jgi:hypothetical protein
VIFIYIKDIYKWDPKGLLLQIKGENSKARYINKISRGNMIWTNLRGVEQNWALL